jgi:hypothetical protein
MEPEVSQDYLHYLWNTLHEQQGRSGEAAVLANQMVESENLEGDYFPEFVRIAAVCALAGSRTASEWNNEQGTGAGNLLLMATKLQSEKYPYGAAWERWNTNPEKDWTATYLRDTFQYLKVLSCVLPDQKLQPLQGGFLYLLKQIVLDEPSNQFGLIAMIEESDQAATYYEQYRKQGYIEDAIKDNPGHVLTVASRAFGGMIEQRDRDHISEPLGDMVQAIVRHPGMVFFGLKQLGKNSIRSWRKSRELTMNRWESAAQTTPEFMRAVRVMKQRLTNVPFIVPRG